ncbi:RING-H2 finger protein ATL66-like [Cucurbita pepo subsp. pepo]|uniref:RING-H2 finger protein ATL66-like n=1 Tax=Cucurbita pepo subsp. pepo TaxID=3664 RepID=UPI000C9D8E5E|nr:RING-H2 finger protein ATL66-like [Cucurbita pepo subsp. pepo]
MPSPPSSTASPPPISKMVNTSGLTWGDEYLALIAVCTVIILYLIVLNCIKSRYFNESDSGYEAVGALPPVIVRIEASVFCYREADGGHGGECAICLDGFEDGQKCRMMNKCGHIFHCRCIDRWLKVECHCPLCRSCVCAVVHPSSFWRR